MPYVIVIIVALLAGLLFWSIYSGEINNLKMPWSSQESSTTSSAEKSKSGESKSKSQSDSASGNKTDASNADSPTDSQQNDQNADQNAGQNAEQTDNATAQQAVNTGTEVRVVNATEYHRLCAKQGRRATQAGYTSVSPAIRRETFLRRPWSGIRTRPIRRPPKTSHRRWEFRMCSKAMDSSRQSLWCCLTEKRRERNKKALFFSQRTRLFCFPLEFQR